MPKVSEKKITINGGCISYRQLYFILKNLKENNEYFDPINKRAASRALKVNEITKDYELFKTFK